jgi:hypothetical protein
MIRYVTKVIQNPGAWVTVGGKRFYGRSKYERNYARYLEFQKKNEIIHDWLHEPKTFWFEAIKRGVRSYLPDFLVCPSFDTSYWVEVKGWLDPKSATKLKRMAKYYPLEIVVVVDSKWFAKNNAKMRMLIKDWE